MIFEFTDYRLFLRTYIKKLPSHGRGEVGKMAVALGTNPTLLSQVLGQKKHVTLDLALKIANYIGLNEFETDFFFSLVQHDRSNDKEVQKYWQKKITASKKEFLKLAKRLQAKDRLSDSERAIFYSSYLFSAIRQFLSTEEKGKTLAEVCERFNLSKARAQSVLNNLKDFNLCLFESGHYKMATQSTFVEKGSPFLAKHFLNWRLKAIQQIDELEDTELMFTSVVSLSKADFTRLREEMAQFIKKFLDTVHDSPAEDVAAFNIDWFWAK